jgi:hypothetical protein
MKVTSETITDEQIRELYAAKAIDEATYIVAIGACGAEVEDDDGELVDPDENEVEMSRARCAAAWNARHGGEP